MWRSDDAGGAGAAARFLGIGVAYGRTTAQFEAIAIPFPPIMPLMWSILSRKKRGAAGGCVRCQR